MDILWPRLLTLSLYCRWAIPIYNLSSLIVFGIFIHICLYLNGLRQKPPYVCGHYRNLLIFCYTYFVIWMPYESKRARSIWSKNTEVPKTARFNLDINLGIILELQNAKIYGLFEQKHLEDKEFLRIEDLNFTFRNL